jgi:1-acyl-sn-glycerol-3-phosphate acyltransferase
VEGLEKIVQTRSYVFISNHSSNLDPLAVAWTLSHTLRFIGKKSLEKIPLFGWAARRARVIFIDRNDSPKAIEAINKVIMELKGGISAIFFAEGTRNLGGKLQSFKKGGVVLALKARLPIVPITILDSYKLFPKKALRIKPGVMRIIIGEPIETAPYNEQDRDRVLERVRSIIFHNLKYYDKGTGV